MIKKLNTVICGNCAQVLAGFPADYIDLTVTSPPYDNLRDYNGYEFDFEPIACQLYRVTKPGGVVVWVVADETKDFGETITTAKQKIYFIDVCGFNLLDTMIYEKNGYPAQYPGMMRYMGAFEYMLVFCKGKPKTFNPICDRRTKTKGESRNNFTQRQKDGSTKHTKSGFIIGEFSARNNVWKYDTGFLKVTKDKDAYNHPAIFPEALARDHIISWSNPGDLVLDPMCGSGTTLKMAKELGRNFIGIDISEEYCRLSQRRVEGARVPLFVPEANGDRMLQPEQLEMDL
jgi:site-specific DNA-methyltransferase (adenine-specific)